MPAKRETIGIGMKVRPELDKRATQDVLKDVQALHRKLSTLKIDWRHIGKQATANVTEIRSMSAAAERFSNSLNKATKKSLDSFKALGNKLEEAQQKAAALSSAYGKAEDDGTKAALANELSDVAANIAELNKQIEDNASSNSDAVKNLNRTAKAQERFTQSLKEAADYTGKNFGKDLTSAIGKLGQGGAGGVKAALGGLLGAGGSAAKGAIARKAQGEQDLADRAGKPVSGTLNFTNLTKAMGGLTAAITALTVLWEIIKAASQHMTKLNKALIDGGGFARDASQSTENYRKSVDRLRAASIASAQGLLAYGANSETAAKAVGAFSRETTGSLIQTEKTLTRLGKGDLNKGFEEFSKSAVIYGKALGMEAEDVGAMMGKFVSEAGYGSDEVQDLMGNVVKAAATANMPMTKFMDIFRQVIPDVDAYRNRLEELTGVIKVLSKTMSAKDVKNFMDAFTKGFSGTDFKQRLKTVLVTGTGFVNDTLKKGFSLRARGMADTFKGFVSEKEMNEAMKGGTGGMAKLMAVAQGRASQKGQELDPAAVSNAMKLAGFEGARQKGGPLNLATALSGASTGETYKILNQMSQRFGTGFDGLNEHVIKQLGISEQQYEALKTTNQSFQVYSAQLKMYGKTQSVSLNSALKKVMAERGETDLSKATMNDIINAGTLSNQFDDAAKKSKTAQELAVEQNTLTTSIDEKLDGLLAFLLEKIFDVLDKEILSTLNDLYEYIALGGDKSGAISAERVEKARIKEEDMASLSEDQKKKYDSRKGAIAGLDEAAGTGNIGAMAGQFNVQDLRGVSGAFSEYAKSKALQGGKSAEEAGAIAQAVQKQMSAGIADGDVNKALWALKDTPGDWKDAFTVLNDMVAKEQADKQKDAMTRRAGYKTTAEKEKEKKDDFVDLQSDVEVLNPVSGDGGWMSGALGQAKSIAAGAAGAGPSGEDMAGYATSRTPGDGGASGGPVDAIKEQGSAQVEASTDVKKGVVEAVADTRKSVDDLYKLVDKGIKLESSFLAGAYKGVIKDATLDSFRTALLEFAVIQAKMTNEEGLSEFGKGLSGRGAEFIDAGGQMSDLFPIAGGDEVEWKTAIDTLKGSRLSGGPIPDTGYYKLHRGEYVVPAMQASTKSSSSGPTTVHMTVNGSGLSQQQLEGAVYSAMDKHARRS